MIYLQLFLSFLKVGMFSVGGGYAAMPLIQSEAVSGYGWLTMSEFTDLITIAEMTPGPIAVNSATFVGIRVAGVLGAVVATFGCILPSCIIVSILSCIYFKYRNLSFLQSVLNSLRPAVVALIASAGLSILKSVVFSAGKYDIAGLNVEEIVIFITAFIVLRRWKVNPILVMTVCGAANLLISFI